MLRVDAAGNISKRYAGESFPFSHFGGTCPRWNLHAAFQTPGQTITPDRRDARRPALLHHQPDDRAADPARSARRQPARHRPRLRRQARRPDRLFRRARPARHAGDAGRPGLRDLPADACPQRATPPAGRMLAVNENRKTISPYPFITGLRARRGRVRGRGGPIWRDRRRRRRSTGGSRRACLLDRWRRAPRHRARANSP